MECKGAVADDSSVLAEKSDPPEQSGQPVITEAYALLALVRAGWTLTPPKGKA